MGHIFSPAKSFFFTIFYTKNIPKDGFLYKEMGSQDHSKNNPPHFRAPNTKALFSLNIKIYNNIAIYKFLF